MGEQTGRDVLVHHCFHTDHRAVGFDGHRDTAAADSDDDRAAVQQLTDHLGLEDRGGPR